jgi:tyrosine-protein kinase Etk/Wzc
MKPKKFSFSAIIRKMGEEQPERRGAAAEAPDTFPAAERRAAREERTGSFRGDERLDSRSLKSASIHSEKRESSSGAAKNSASRFRTGNADSEEELEFDFFRYLGIILQRRRPVAIVMLLVTSFCIFQYVNSERLYTAHAQLRFKPEDKELIGDDGPRNPGNQETALNTHLELLKSNAVLSMVADSFGNRVHVAQIEHYLSIAQGQTNRERNDLIELYYQNPDARLARDVLNELCQAYINYQKEVNAQEITALLSKLGEQVNKFQAELDLKEGDLRRFKEENRMVELSDETNLTVSKLSELELDLQKTEMSLLEGREKDQAVTSQIGKQTPDVVQSVTYIDPTKDKLAQLELEYNTLSAENSPEHFKVKILKEEIEKLKRAEADTMTREATSQTLVNNPILQSLLQDKVDWNVDRSSLEAKRQALINEVKNLNADLFKLPAVQQRYAFLERETESLVQTLKLLKSKQAEAQVQRDGQKIDIIIQNLASLPTQAVPSVKFITVIMGLFIGLIFGVGLAFLLEYLDQSVKDPIQIEKNLDLPLLGIVPVIETNKALIQQFADLEKKVLEPFRSLRANLKHLAAMHNSKVFMICSAIKGEGKTTLAANLAITFAVDGKKTILVDADLRRSQMHSLFAIPKELGLTDYLLGVHTVDEVLKTTVLENLSLITSGERPHNPSELVGTYRFDLLVKELRDRADIIIFDSPALLPVSDALTMAPKMDGSVMVFRTNWTPLKAAKQAKHQIARLGCTIFGGIFNGVSLHRSYYPYYYGYYGYYSYSKYTYDDDKKKGSAFREFGLRLENGFRKGVQGIRYGAPKYIAAARSFGRLFAGRRALPAILLACGLSAAGIWSLHRALYARQHRAAIASLVTAAAPAAAPSSGVSQAAPKDTASIMSDPLPADPEGRTDAPLTPEAGSGLWFAALKASDLDGYLRLYDSVDFQFSGGNFSRWRERAKAYFARYQGSSYTLDSVWRQVCPPPGIETRLRLTMVSGPDTTRLVKALSWKNGRGGWRIIGDKTGRAL